ncbi:hypothetical protein EVAR_33920_1 [Eumeta japonica]|uniref:Uncharacterized protein n=1 Tax=Eumeta variegata TaxID=151549 RepID=A0A4C1VYI8_EUMVA|nr:hypothetical protein EVAR_33920_1 [Eumeta japonica]
MRKLHTIPGHLQPKVAGDAYPTVDHHAAPSLTRGRQWRNSLSRWLRLLCAMWISTEDSGYDTEERQRFYDYDYIMMREPFTLT